jgi:hypothetical protein
MSGQLLLDLPIVLEGAVSFNVQNRQEEIFLKLLQSIKHNEEVEDYRNILSFIEEWHRNNIKHPFMFSNGCGCDYCVKTREYANLKLSIHRLRNMLDNNYSLYPSEREKADSAFLHTQESKLVKLIKERREMRIHLGFISKRVLK